MTNRKRNKARVEILKLIAVLLLAVPVFAASVSIAYMVGTTL